VGEPGPPGAEGVRGPPVSAGPELSIVEEGVD
jgi:hypothetical protein